jgi:hypothetical protein
MSVFYVLPPRPLVGQQFARFLQGCFPGLTWAGACRLDLAESVSAAGQSNPDVFVVFREDLPEDCNLQEALKELFGAEGGDEVVEVTSSALERWRVPA